MTLLTKQPVQVLRANDVVELQIGRSTASFGYNTALHIAQGLRLASNLTGRRSGIPAHERRELRTTLPDLDPDLRAHQAETLPSAASVPWEVKVDGELVVLVIGDFIARFEAPTAAEIAGMIRARAKEAKTWAGDRGKTLRAAGNLTDAGVSAGLVD